MLDKNESYWLLTEELIQACRAFGSKELSSYPDYTFLKEKIASYVGVDSSNICIAAGSDAVIDTISRTLLHATRKAIVPVPTFYGYESILSRAEIEILPVPYTEHDFEFIFPLEEVLELIRTSGADVLFLCHPNNPLGLSIPESCLKEILEAAYAKSMLVVSDEAYFEYGGKTVLPLMKEFTNLIILRTFSKAFGLSGARIGYCIADSITVRKLEKQLLPWPVAHTSVFAAITVLSHQEIFEERRKLYIAHRELFLNKLRTFDTVTVYNSEANFSLLRVSEAEKIALQLRNKGIVVALGSHMSKYPEVQELLRSTIRIAIPAPEHTDRVLAALQDALL